MPESATDQPSVIRPPFRADHVGSLARPPELIRNDRTEDEQWARLALVVETALEVWGSG